LRLCARALKRFLPDFNSDFTQINFLHICNDGFQASFLLLLPFIAKDFHLSLTQVGVLGTLQNAVLVALALPTSYIALKIGGMRTLLLAICLYALGFIGMTFSPVFLWLIPMFILGGFGFGLFHPSAFSVIAARATKETRGRAMGNFTAIGEVGRIGISAIMTFLVVIPWLALYVTSLRSDRWRNCARPLSFSFPKKKKYLSKLSHQFLM